MKNIVFLVFLFIAVFCNGQKSQPIAPGCFTYQVINQINQP